ncbi:MAG TPA: DUF72 domain-containing protein [Gemmatimonadales bacterium]|nr:DUF72 domain-containing protein [Gemmatimonadales bacterium]
MRVHVGTSGYNFPEWKGSFYPAKLATKGMLSYYAERLSTVEINYTFYRMPNTKTVAGWDAQTPAGFTFVLKAPQRITHIARLKNVDDPLRFFTDVALTLGPKLGAVLVQLPPNFKQDLTRLGDFLALARPELRLAFEFRHASWFADPTYELLRSYNAALCVADTEAGNTPVVATADFGYARLRDEGYTRPALRQWAETLRGISKEWKDAFVFFKHEEGGEGPRLAGEFAGLFRA